MMAPFTVAGMLGRGGSPLERGRARLLAAGAALATWFLFGAVNVLALHGSLDDRLGPISQPGTRGGTALGFALMVLAVAAFLYQAVRLASADRERRLAALRLAGATPRDVRLIGAVETTRAAFLGTVVGAAAFLLLQWAGRRLLLHPGSRADVDVPPLPALAAMVLVLASAAVSGLLAGRHVVASPLGVTRRAARPRPRPYGLALVLLGCASMLAGWAGQSDAFDPAEPYVRVLLMAGGLATVIGLLLSASGMAWLTARAAGRRARTAETLLAARALEADARPWGRTLSVVGLAVAIGAGSGWIEASVMDNRHELEPFWLSSFLLVDLALLVGTTVAAAAILVHQAEYLLEHGPVLAALHAGGVPERGLRRVLVRQALIAAPPVCVPAALAGFAAMADPWLENPLWLLWPVARALLMVALGVLATVLAAAASRRRLRRAIAPERLRAE